MSMNGVKKNQSGRGNGVSVTVRYALDLVKPSEEGYEYEYSYEQLLEDKLDVKKTAETSRDNNSLSDTFSRDSQDLQAIAKRFEEKYGPRKRKKFHDTDLIDRGSGYDVTDSFVDDAELYEDYVPHQLDTKFGGFYVNVGGLEFKTVDDVEQDELDFIKNKKFKPPKVRKHSSFQTPKVILASQKLKKAKQQMQQKTASGSSMLKVTPSLKLAGRPPVSHSQQQPNTPTHPPRPPAVKKIKLSQTEKSMLSSSPKISTPSKPATGNVDSTVNTLSANISKMMSSLPVINLSNKLGQAEVAGSGIGSPVNEGSPLTQVPKEPPKLPNKLPSLVLDKVVELEQMIIQAQGADGRLSNKARMSYDKHLVDIHIRCQGLAVRVKNAVLDYLGYKMGVARLTLTKRMKQELKREEDTELGKSIADLKKAIDAIIPEQMGAYESDVKARAESLTSQPAAVEKLTSEEDSRMDEVFEENTAGSVNSTPVISSSTQKKLPRKRFKWNEETKRLLCKAVSVKISCAKKWVWGIKLTPDEVVGNFLENKIKPLWPKGWMQKSILLKMSELSHKHYTSAAKKAVPGSQMKADVSSPIQSSSSATSVSTAAGAGATVAGHQKTPVSTSSSSSSPIKVIPQTKSAPSLLAGSSDAASILKELEALKNTSQRNDGKISSGGLGKALTNTGNLGATHGKKLLTSSKAKLVAVHRKSQSPGSLSPKLKKLLPSSKTSPKGVVSTQPLTLSMGAVAAARTTAASSTGSSASKVTVSKHVVPVLKQTSPGSSSSSSSITATTTNPVTYLLTKNSVSISQFIQDLQKHQLQQQSTPVVTATATITSPHSANSAKSVASNSKTSLTGKAIIAKNPASQSAKSTSLLTAKGKPTVSSSAKLPLSRVASSASPPGAAQMSAKPTVPVSQQLLSNSMVTTNPSSLASHSSKQSPSTPKQSASPVSVEPQILTMQGLQKLVNKIASASSQSLPGGVKIAIQDSSPMQSAAKEKISVNVSSQKAQARASHKAVGTNTGQSHKVLNPGPGTVNKSGGGIRVVGGSTSSGVSVGSTGRNNLGGASTHIAAAGRGLSSAGTNTSSAIVAGKTSSVATNKTPVPAARKAMASASASMRSGSTAGGRVPVASSGNSGSGKVLAPVIGSSTSPSSVTSGRNLAPVISGGTSSESGAVGGLTLGTVGSSVGSSQKVLGPAKTLAAGSQSSYAMPGFSASSSVVAKSGTSPTSFGSKTSHAVVSSGRNLAPAASALKSEKVKITSSSNTKSVPTSHGNLPMSTGSRVAAISSGQTSLSHAQTSGGVKLGSSATGSGKATVARGNVSSISNSGVSVVNVGRGKDELVRNINSTSPHSSAALLSSQMPPPLITADALDSDWNGQRAGSKDNNVIVITDTPPRSSPPGTTSTRAISSEQLFIPLSLSPSPNSPLVSPMDQIMEEHSYLTPRSSS